jgi:hypothetical protein
MLPPGGAAMIEGRTDSLVGNVGNGIDAVVLHAIRSYRRPAVLYTSSNRSVLRISELEKCISDLSHNHLLSATVFDEVI